jgi:hypothetical protein
VLTQRSPLVRYFGDGEELLMARLSDVERAELEQRRERLQVELLLVTAQLRSDEALRLQQEARPKAERPRLHGGWRRWIE